MLRAFKLLLPALLPAWNFFDFIAPSPRIQYALLTPDQESPSDWHEFQPRPHTISFYTMLRRLLWNPRWNETLFMVSCAERLLEKYTKHSEDEILKRIIREFEAEHLQTHSESITDLQFRLLQIQRQGNELQETIGFYSRIEPLSSRDST